MTQPLFLNWAPVAAFLAMGISTFTRAAILRRQGITAIVLPRDETPHGHVARLFKFLVVAGVALCLAYAIQPGIAAQLGPLEWLMHPLLAWAGAALMALGAIIVAIAQTGMGRSFRVGVDERERTALVTTGLYRFSRNPIYLGMMLVVMGVFLIAPNAATFAFLSVAAAMVSTQIRLEEDFLRRLHGTEFDAYLARTRRWI